MRLLRAHITPALRGCVAPVLVCLLFSAGCSTYANRSMVIKGALVDQNFDEALKNVEKIDKSTSELLYYYEKGLVLHYQNRYQESNEAFAQAEIVLEDLYTKSLTRELAALAVNDAVAKYRGDPHEAMLIHYYKILNYLYLGDMDGALVECRRVNIKLQMLRDAGEFYENDPFLQYLTGILYSEAGDDVDAGVSYRVATEAFETLGDSYGIRAPEALYCDAATNAARLGDFQEEQAYLAKGECPQLDDPRAGSVGLFIEVGYVAHKLETNISLPIYDDDDWNDDDKFAVKLADRRNHARRSVKVAYWLRVALPVLETTPVPVREAVMSARHVSGPDSASVAVKRRATVVENLDRLATVAFQEKEGKILLRAIIRALGKYAMKKAADKKGEGLGLLVNIAGAATENADTRSWSTLPQRILLARTWLPPGVYDLDVTLTGPSGEVSDRFTIPNVEVQPGRTTFLNYRIY